MEAASSRFLDVPVLLESSQPRPRARWLWYAAGGFVLLVLLSTYLTRQSAQMQAAVQVLSAVMMLALVGVMMVITWLAIRRQRAEQQQLEAIEELVQLRRWEPAGLVLEEILSHPTRTPYARVQALLYLTQVLARYERFGEAIEVQDHLLQYVEGPVAHALRLGRAMALLREDRLVDADRAISELRQSLPNGVEGARGTSAGLAMIEIYRDVKTGHPEEAIELFERHLPELRKQLGQRVADAYVLAAAAYDGLDRPADAQAAFEKATLLSTPIELFRRYPETKHLADKYRPVDRPYETT